MSEQDGLAGIVEFSRPDRNPERPKPLDWQEYQDRVLAGWYDLLSREPNESEVQYFLELHPAMIPGGSGDVGPGGHHHSEMAAVFRTPELKGSGRSFRPDFMWVTRSSSLITPIVIEIEKPSKRWFKKDGRPTERFTQAHDQLNDWRAWFAHSENQSIFRERFLFNERYSSRQLEPWFVLIFGRQSEFEHGGLHQDPDALRWKRDGMRRDREQFMTFDSLRPRFDHGSSVTLSMEPEGPRLHAFSPVYGTDAHVGTDAILLGDPTDALARSVMMSDERKQYLAQRWEFWREDELERRAMKVRRGFELGLE